MKPTLLSICIAVLLTACKPSGTKNASDDFFVISVESALDNKQSINLTDIAASVKYVPLQTDSNCMLRGGNGFHFTDEYIFFENQDHLVVFNHKGDFIRKIGTPGKGPHEIDFVIGTSLIEKEQLIAIKTLATNQMLFFDFNGQFIESVKAPGFFTFALQKDIYLIYDMCSIGNEDYFFRLTNKANDTLAYVVNPYKWQNNTGTYMMIIYGLFHPYYRYKKQDYFKSMYNDTVFTTADGKITPAYLIDLGKHKLPIELRPENPASKEAFERVAPEKFYAFALEGSGKHFLTISNYKEDVIQNIVYNKVLNEGILLLNEKDESSTYVNDWDNGPGFWPEGNVNDNTFYMKISPVKIKELVESDEFKNSSGNEKNKKALIELAQKLKEDDNTVLMMVTLK